MRNVPNRTLLSRLKTVQGETPFDSVFEEMREIYGIDHVVYHGTNVHGLTAKGPYLRLTYSDDWFKRYFDRNYLAIDPVVEASMKSTAPVRWNELDWSAPAARRFYGDAVEHKVGQTGLSVPIRGVTGEHAILSVTTSQSDRDWSMFLDDYMGDFVILAHTLHEAVMRNEAAVPVEPMRPLTAREREILHFAAQGLRTDAIAERLKITERTVRAHLESARKKLNALNRIHAVSKAIGLGLILAPY